MKKAVIAAAGQSSRLRPLTLHTPKGLLKINDETLLGRSIRCLRANGVEEIAIVVGFEAQQIIAAFGESTTCIVNPFFRQCNNMGSLWFARAFSHGGPFLYLHADLMYHEDLIKDAVHAARTEAFDLHLITDFGPVDDEAMKVRVNPHGLLLESNKEIPIDEAAGEWTGIACVKASHRLFEVIEEELLAGHHDAYDTRAFTRMAEEGFRVTCGAVAGRPWKEIDFQADFEAAQRMFRPKPD